MGFIIDLTREEGARILEEDLFLYDEAKRLKDLINNLLENREQGEKNSEIKEFFATNIFLSGSRGTGKTSILLTLRNFLKNNERIEIIDPIDLSVNYTGIVFYILSYFKVKLEKNFKPTDCCSSSKLEELFDKLVNNFPKFLKCFCNNDCSFLCNEELEILLDQHEISFLKNFFEFIDKILGNKTLILILDDIDLIPEPKILLRTILELAVFLNHPKIIIIGAGDLENLKLRLLNALKSINFYNQKENKDKKELTKLYEEMVLALIDKIFPLTNRINLSKITPHLLEKISIITFDEYSKEKIYSESLREFLKKHPSFGSFGNVYEHYFNDIVKYLFSDISLREFVQVLRTIKQQIDKARKSEKFKVKDLLVSKILINLYFEDFIMNLRTNFDIDIRFSSENRNIKLEYPRASEREFFIKELEEANFEAFVSFLHFIREIIFKTNVNYLEGKKSVLSLIYTYNPKLAYLIQLWGWEINLYLKGHIYFYPLVYLMFLLMQGLHKNYFEDKRKEYIPELRELIDNLLSSATTKENLYIHLSIILGDTVKSAQKLKKEFRNVLLFNLDVKNINNYYPILKFFKGFIIITKLGNTQSIDENWIIDFYNYKTLGELVNFPENAGDDKDDKSNLLDNLRKNLKYLLDLSENVDLNKVKISNLTLQDLDFLSLAYYRTWETRIEKKGFTDEFKKENLHYWLPFYTFIGFYIDRNFPNILLSSVKSLFGNHSKEDTSTKSNNSKKKKDSDTNTKSNNSEKDKNLCDKLKNELSKKTGIEKDFLILIPSFGNCYSFQYEIKLYIKGIYKEKIEELKKKSIEKWKQKKIKGVKRKSIEHLKEIFLKEKVKKIIELAFLKN